MILALAVPELGMGIKKARVSSWKMREGEPISFGEIVCILQVREWEMAGRTKDASRLAKLKRKGKQQPTGNVPMRCPTCGDSEDLSVQLACDDCLRFQVMASESGTLRSIKSPAGSEVTIGDVVAHVDAEGEDSDTEDHPKMRIVVDLMDRAEGDS